MVNGCIMHANGLLGLFELEKEMGKEKNEIGWKIMLELIWQ